jgi:hypothetical protein
MTLIADIPTITATSRWAYRDNSSSDGAVGNTWTVLG